LKSECFLFLFCEGGYLGAYEAKQKLKNLSAIYGLEFKVMA